MTDDDATKRPAAPAATGPLGLIAGSEAGPPALSAAERRVIAVLGRLHRQAAAMAAELRQLGAALPEPTDAEAEAMEEGQVPYSVAHVLQSTIGCALCDGAEPLAAMLARGAAIDRRELEAEWRRSLRRSPGEVDR